VRIGCSQSLMPFLVRVIEYISRQHPRLHFHVQEARWPTVEFPELLERKIDLTFARLASFPRPGRLHDELQAEVLFDDPFCAVVGLHSKWAHRRRLDLAELSNERWLSTPPDVLAGRFVTEAFEASGLQPPRPAVATSSTYVRGALASRGDYIAVVPRSMLILDKQRHALRRLPITLSAKPSPVAIVTLKNRSLTPTVLKFIETARQIANFYFNKRKGRGRLSPT
jgi:DNA-binding transcriptional LysR family regulator